MEGISLFALGTHYDRHLLLAVWTHEVSTTFRTKNSISARNIRCNYDAELLGKPEGCRGARVFVAVGGMQTSPLLSRHI